MIPPAPAHSRPCEHVREDGRQCGGIEDVTREHRHWYVPSVAELLELEATGPRSPGLKQALIRERFGIGMARWGQYLIDALESIEALQIDAITTNRLRRQYAARAAQRRSRSFG